MNKNKILDQPPIMRTASKFALLVFFHLFSVALFSQNHSFSYLSPACKNGVNPAPITSTNFVSGGTFVAVPSGLSINAATGVINLAGSNPGSYIITYSGSFTNAPVSTTISVVQPPTVNIFGPAIICLGASFTLTAIGSSATYSWNTGATTNTLVSVATGPTVYVVTGTSANGCTTTNTRVINPVPPPTVSITANPTVCIGYIYTLQATGATSYTWPGIGATTPIASVTVNGSTNTYTVVGSTLGCTASAVHTVVIMPIPTISIVGTNTLCAGGTVSLIALGGITYSWNTGANTQTLSSQVFFNSVYSVFGTDIVGCTSSATLAITAFPRPNIIIPGSTNLCEGVTVTLTPAGANTYTWNNGSQTPTLAFTPVQDTTLVLDGTSIHGCQGSKTLSLLVFPNPTVSVNSTSICSTKTATLQVSGPSTQMDGIFFRWLPNLQTDTVITVSPPTTSAYTLIATAGPCSVSAVSTVQVIQTVAPQTSFFYPGPFCTNSPVKFPTIPSNFARGGTFFSTSPLNVDGSTGAIDLNGLSSGLYSVTYSIAAQGCTLAANPTVYFEVNKTVKIEMEPLIEVLPGKSVRLYNTGGATSYQWSPNIWLSCGDCQTPLATPLSTMVYCVSSFQTCVEGSCVTVEVICVYEGDYSVPSAFTPNGDGKNETFCLKGWDQCSKEFSISIFDRWGAIVFESRDPNFCWDGYYNGSLLPSGVYVYVINARFGKEPAMRKSGNITIIR